MSYIAFPFYITKKYDQPKPITPDLMKTKDPDTKVFHTPDPNEFSSRDTVIDSLFK